jgi:hypothetical protein
MPIHRAPEVAHRVAFDVAADRHEELSIARNALSQAHKKAPRQRRATLMLARNLPRSLGADNSQRSERGRRGLALVKNPAEAGRVDATRRTPPPPYRSACRGRTRRHGQAPQSESRQDPHRHGLGARQRQSSADPFEGFMHRVDLVRAKERRAAASAVDCFAQLEAPVRRALNAAVARARKSGDLHKSQVAPGTYRHSTVARSRESDFNVIINHAHVCIV